MSAANSPAAQAVLATSLLRKTAEKLGVPHAENLDLLQLAEAVCQALLDARR